jgi:DNA-binding transcriptional LysR family regulator
VSDRAATALAPLLRLRTLAPPLPLSPYALHLLWHPRLEHEPANRWLRDVFVRAAKDVELKAPAGVQRAARHASRRPRTGAARRV